MRRKHASYLKDQAALLTAWADARKIAGLSNCDIAVRKAAFRCLSHCLLLAESVAAAAAHQQ